MTINTSKKINNENNSKTISILDQVKGELNDYFFSRLENDLGEGKNCFNCKFCGDIVTYTGEIKDSVIECLGKQSGINNIHIDSSCDGHNYIENYFKRNKGD